MKYKGPQRYALEIQISEFGNVPKQIFRCVDILGRYTALPSQVHGRVRRGVWVRVVLGRVGGAGLRHW